MSGLWIMYFFFVLITYLFCKLCEILHNASAVSFIHYNIVAYFSETKCPVVHFVQTGRSFCLTAVPKDKKSKLLKYKFEVKRLPADVSTDSKKTFIKVSIIVLKIWCIAVFRTHLQSNSAWSPLVSWKCNVECLLLNSWSLQCSIYFLHTSRKKLLFWADHNIISSAALCWGLCCTFKCTA